MIKPEEVYEAILEQGPANEGTTCLYRTLDGRKCAAGMVIPDKYTREDLKDNCHFQYLPMEIRRDTLDNLDVDLPDEEKMEIILRMQRAHDRASQHRAFKEKFKERWDRFVRPFLPVMLAMLLVGCGDAAPEPVPDASVDSFEMDASVDSFEPPSDYEKIFLSKEDGFSSESLLMAQDSELVVVPLSRVHLRLVLPEYGIVQEEMGVIGQTSFSLDKGPGQYVLKAYEYELDIPMGIVMAKTWIEVAR